MKEVEDMSTDVSTCEVNFWQLFFKSEMSKEVSHPLNFITWSFQLAKILTLKHQKNNLKKKKNIKISILIGISTSMYTSHNQNMFFASIYNMVTISS